ncbi:MAG: hypothetical protein H5T86_14920, partial [Armatimonadetes bacterium]|nr:hypothetical protein [Armatimonadota bacterium]
MAATPVCSAARQLLVAGAEDLRRERMSEAVQFVAMWLALAAAPPLRWEMERAQEVTGIENIQGARLIDGRLCGMTSWDPYVYLSLPQGGINAEDYRTLRARIF